MIKRIDHIAIAVRDPKAARQFFTESLGGRVLVSEPLPVAGLHWTLVELGESCLLELVHPLEGDNPVRRFLDRRGDGAHHITIQVTDIEATRRRLEERSVPVFGFGEPVPGWKELFVHPKHAFGILLQFAEFDPLDWVPPDQVPAPYRGFAEERASRAVSDILLLGDPRLRRSADPVTEVTVEVREAARCLALALDGFRTVHGFGRGVAATQLGTPLRIVALHIDAAGLPGAPADGSTFVMLNPEITARSEQTFTCWDDCMSFPWLRVRLARHATIDVRWTDLRGVEHQWSGLDRERSELLQHELDHLDGVLALDRALGHDALVSRAVFEADPQRFLEQVDET